MPPFGQIRFRFSWFSGQCVGFDTLEKLFYILVQFPVGLQLNAYPHFTGLRGVSSRSRHRNVTILISSQLSLILLVISLTYLSAH